METFTIIRMVIGYPLAAVGGLVWLLGFGAIWWVSPADSRNSAAGWSALTGAGVMAYGLTGLFALWLSDRIGFGPLTSGIFTGGQAALLCTTVAGAVWLLRQAWLTRCRQS